MGLCPQGESTRKGLKKKRKRKERKEGRKERKKGEDDGRMKENERRTDECRKRATNDERAQRKEANKPSSHMLRHVASCDVTGHFMNRSFGQLRPLLRIEFKPNSIIALTNRRGSNRVESSRRRFRINQVRQPHPGVAEPHPSPNCFSAFGATFKSDGVQQPR